jgi:hypothetical protein
LPPLCRDSILNEIFFEYRTLFIFRVDVKVEGFFVAAIKELLPNVCMIEGV